MGFFLKMGFFLFRGKEIMVKNQRKGKNLPKLKS